MRIDSAKARSPRLAACQLSGREILKWIEENIGRIGDPDAAVADRDAGGDIEAVDDGGDLVELAVALGALQQLDAILARPGAAARILDRSR